jgi:hypothetical protein
MWSPRRRRPRPRSGRWPDATNQDVIDSVVPVATGLAAVAAATPPDVVLAQQFPDAARPGSTWHALLAANGRPIH